MPAGMPAIDPQSKTGPAYYGPGRRAPSETAIRCDHAARRVVGAAGSGVRRPVHVYSLLNVGCATGQPLLFGPVPLAVLFAGTVRSVAPQPVRTEAGVVARLAAVLA